MGCGKSGSKYEYVQGNEKLEQNVVSLIKCLSDDRIMKKENADGPAIFPKNVPQPILQWISDIFINCGIVSRETFTEYLTAEAYVLSQANYDAELFSLSRGLRAQCHRSSLKIPKLLPLNVT
eukprot:g14308.t1